MQIYEVAFLVPIARCRKCNHVEMIRSFRDLVVWNAAMDLVLTTYALAANFLRRSALSWEHSCAGPRSPFRRTSPRAMREEPGSAT